MRVSDGLHRDGTRGARRRGTAAAALLTALLAALPVVALLAGLLAGLLVALPGPAARAAYWFGERPMPEFTNQHASAWLNSKPLTREELRGKVVLIEVFTSG
jgi:hypothetical protein